MGSANEIPAAKTADGTHPSDGTGDRPDKLRFCIPASEKEMFDIYNLISNLNPSPICAL